MNPLLITGLMLTGLAIGWVGRGMIFRLAVRADEPRRCACTGCGYQVPVSWWEGGPALAPSGRCPACRAPIGPAPLAPELTTGLVLCALTARPLLGLVLAAAAWLGVCAVILAWIDATVHRLPDAISGPAYAGTLGLLLLAAVGSEDWGNLGRAVLGGLVLAAFYLLLTVISPSGMGLGDVKLAAAVGTLLAWSGWAVLLDGTFAAFALGGLYGIGLLTLGRATRKQHIAFGPFILIGALAAIVL